MLKYLLVLLYWQHYHHYRGVVVEDIKHIYNEEEKDLDRRFKKRNNKELWL